jgi:acetoin utilization deacetylase AcuC-like enzyme
VKIIFDGRQLRHQGAGEFTREQLLPCFELPLRIKSIISELQKAGFEHSSNTSDFGIEPILRVHDEAFVAFLQTA